MRAPCVYIETFGCQMNEYDTELVRSILKNRGYGFTDTADAADVVLLNTCAIRENAHNKVYGHLGALKHLKEDKGVVIGVLGCMAQNLKTDLMGKDSLIDVLAGPDSYRALPDLLEQAAAGKKALAVDLSEYETYVDIAPDRVAGVAAWVAVMRGCDNFCTFCVVPYTRGRERSRTLPDVVREIEAAAESGCKQVTLLGQNVNSYHDGTSDFADLLCAAASVSGIERVRFTSPHPKDFPEKLLDAVAEHPKICKHIHLPAQAGNDRILAMMNRTYTCTEYRKLVEQILTRCPQIVLTTDIIAGFCSEADDEYKETYRLLEDIRFASAYVFKYSERKHTIAARKFADDVSEQVKSERVTQLIELQRGISLAYNLGMIGEVMEILVEGEGKRADQWMGRTDGNIVTVFPKTHGTLKPGSLISVRIVDATVTTLYGESALS
ncbi:MAG: tRNA (N6-isopentenyl adenosine(37)-C2)-methylthiotransferase MiaB [Nitrospirae bacterium]|nr:MAG: tRNA (N6-isopentenyl adenosine(37)-C2)-methylthiotransferase MiaB [Nitrospirota bacterium]